MSRWPRSLVARLLLAAIAAAALIALLELALRQRDDRAMAAMRVDAAPAAGRLGRAAGVAEPSGLPDDRGYRAQAVVLCDAAAAVPAAEARWQLLTDGRVVLRDPPPRADGPGRQHLGTVALALPGRRLSALTPTQRAGLLDLLSSLFPERPVGEDRLLLGRGVEGGPGDIAALLRWLR